MMCFDFINCCIISQRGTESGDKGDDDRRQWRRESAPAQSGRASMGVLAIGVLISFLMFAVIHDVVEKSARLRFERQAATPWVHRGTCPVLR